MEIHESLQTDLTCAVLLVDDFTGKTPLGRLKVAINKEIGRYGIANRSGYYLFLNLKDRLLDSSENTISVESQENYYQGKVIFFSKAEIANNPVVTINLFPSTSYPFSSNETLVRGTVMTEATLDGNTFLKPVSGAKVEIPARNLQFITGHSGDFIFCFSNLRKEDVVVADGQKRFIKMGSSTSFDLAITCKGFKSLNQPNCRAQAYTTTVIHTSPLEVE